VFVHIRAPGAIRNNPKRIRVNPFIIFATDQNLK
jgi:hypothetical protein